MSNIEALKEQARRHEQDEEWQKACDLYLRALDRRGSDEEPDIGLYNRVGDLKVRLGDYDDAVRQYERAVDLYLESGLPNNAIAVCKKLLRHLPQRVETHLRMGQIRASQGFLVDAREHFLSYAEKMQASGHTEEALAALVEFAEAAPEDSEIRMAVALQLLQHDRPEEALEQLAQGYRVLMGKGDEEGAEPFRDKLLSLDPELDLAALLEGDSVAAAPDADLAFEATALGDVGEMEGASGFDSLQVEGNQLPFEPVGASPETAEASSPGSAGDEDAPPQTADEEDDDETLGGDLPLIPVEFDGKGGDSADAGAPDAGPTPLEDWRRLHDRILAGGGGPGAAEALVEQAFRLDDPGLLVESYLLLAEALVVEGEADRSRSVFRQVLSLDPHNARARSGLDGLPEEESVAEAPEGESSPAAPEPSGGFVDLGALVFDEPRSPASTRFTVEYEEPSGDEDADFSRVLDQFKAKVSENFDYADVRAHHDLGTAYKEMGLLGEAVEKFQQALRAAPAHLPTYELLGQVFMEQGEDRAAVRVLERALRVPTQIEDELVGIYYYLARAHEKLGNTGDAVDFYDRVFALDINFADVTDRLRRLR